MAQFFNKSANNIAKTSMMILPVLAVTAFFAYTQIALLVVPNRTLSGKAAAGSIQP